MLLFIIKLRYKIFFKKKNIQNIFLESADSVDLSEKKYDERKLSGTSLNRSTRFYLVTIH